MKTNLALLDQTNGQSPRRLADTKAKIGSDKTNESFKTPPRRQIVRQVSSDSNAEKYAFVTTRRCRTRRRSFLKTPPPTVVSKDVKGLEDGLTDVSDTPQRKPRATSTSSDTENARRSTLPDLSSPKVNKTTDNKTPNAEVGDFYYFEALIGHDGPPSNRSKTSKGSVYNVLVKWANGEESWEPLNQMIEDAPEECAKYAADNDLLDELGWASLKKYLDEEVEDCVSEEAKVDPHGTTGDCVAATPEQVHPFESVLESGDSPLHLELGGDGSTYNWDDLSEVLGDDTDDSLTSHPKHVARFETFGVPSPDAKDGTPSGDLQGLFDEPYTELSKDVDLGSDCLVALMQAGLIATPSPSGGEPEDLSDLDVANFDFLAAGVADGEEKPGSESGEEDFDAALGVSLTKLTLEETKKP